MKGGHDVPFDKIEIRYYRSLDLLYDACPLCYQAFVFDNSENDKPFIMFAQFKKICSEKKWDTLKERDIPNWVRVYYSQKVLKLKLQEVF